MNSIVKDYMYLKASTPNLVNRSNLNNENFGNFITGISRFLKSKITGIKSIIDFNKTKLTATTREQKVNDIGTLLTTDNVCNEISNRDEKHFKRVSVFIVPYIPGVKVDLPTLVDGLSKFEKLITNDVNMVLDEADTFIAKVSGDVEYRVSQIPYETDLFINTGKECFEYLNNIMDEKLVDDNKKLEEVIPNFKSLYITHRTLINLTSKIDVKLLTKLQERVLILSNRVDDFIKLVNDGNVNISNTRLNEICNVLQYSAQLVTDVSSLVRLIDASEKIQLYIVNKLSNLK